jgi:glycerol-3-phosphate acyltransferase PlsX
MGGDFAPDETIKGVILAQKELELEDVQLTLFGKELQIIEKLSQNNVDSSVFTIVDCSETIQMEDDPVKSFKEKSSSEIVKGFYYLKNNLIDGFASAGNTGAMMVGATTIIGAIEGILRPGISSYYPNSSGKKSLIMDVGINADAKPETLYQYAMISNLYAKYIMGMENPKIGLLNIGSEESKGNTVAKQAHKLMKNSKDFNFIGNVEGGDLRNPEIVDVIITDGFTGNVVLKHAESFYEMLKERNINDPFFENYNYENYGGTPVLGIEKTVVVGHGVSNDIAIKNMILLTKEIISSKLSEKISKLFAYGTN